MAKKLAATEDQNADDDSEPPRKKVKIETPEEEIARKDADSREPGKNALRLVQLVSGCMAYN
jgi:hypothetical protein